METLAGDSAARRKAGGRLASARGLGGNRRGQRRVGRDHPGELGDLVDPVESVEADDPCELSAEGKTPALHFGKEAIAIDEPAQMIAVVLILDAQEISLPGETFEQMKKPATDN